MFVVWAKCRMVARCARLRGPARPLIAEAGACRCAAGAELFDDVVDVRGKGGLGDVVRVGDVFVGMPEVGGSALGVGFLVDERGDGLAEGVRGEPLEIEIRVGLAPRTAT